MRSLLIALVIALLPACQTRLTPWNPGRDTHTSRHCAKEVGALLVDGGLVGGSIALGMAWTDRDYRARAGLFALATMGVYSTLSAATNRRGIVGCLYEMSAGPSIEHWRASAKDGTEWGMCRFTGPACDGDLTCEDGRMVPLGAPADGVYAARTLRIGMCVSRERAHGPYCDASGGCPATTTCDPELRFPGHAGGVCVRDREPFAPGGAAPHQQRGDERAAHEALQEGTDGH